MATIVRSATGTVTEVIMTSNTTGSPDEDPVTIESLMVSLDSCPRDSVDLVKNTIAEMLSLVENEVMEVEEEKVKRAEDIIKNVLLIAFKRRNHLKAQADGEGAGEKRFLLEVILAILSMKKFDHLVKNVLHLIPLYGCWKDLRLLGEEILLQAEQEQNVAAALAAASGSSSQQLVSASASSSAGRDHPVYQEICRIYADQLLTDAANTEAPPSNACKYAPHESRHEGKKVKPDSEEEDEDAMDCTTPGAVSAFVAAGDHVDRKRRLRGERPGGESSRRRAGGRFGAAAAKAAKKPSKYPRESLHRASRHMANDITKITHPQEAARNRGSAAYRKLRASLNKRLTEQGFLIEPLIASSQYNEIDFMKASKGALTKYKSAINRNGQKERWQQAMKSSDKAVPDMYSFAQAVKLFREEGRQEDDNNAFKMFPLQLKKAIKTLKVSTSKLLKSAKERLVAAGKSPDSLSKTPMLIAVDTTDATHAVMENSSLSLVLAGFLLAKSLNMEYIMINGHVRSLIGVDDEDWYTLLPVSYSDSTPEATMNRFRNGLDALLQHHARALQSKREEPDAESSEDAVATNSAVSNEPQNVDIAFLCDSFVAYNTDRDAVHQWIEDAKVDVQGNGVSLRTFRVQRISLSEENHDVADDGVEVEYTARPEVKARLPTDVKEITADLLFIVDFTGSMGSYMDAVKQHLIKVIEGIQQDAGLKKIRVGLVGYRDYSDNDRVVVVDFHEQHELGALLFMINRQQANGGGDAPEDMLSAFVAASQLKWQSHIRLQVIISDANAHGYETTHSGFGRGGDDYPTGRCPDQLESNGYPDLPQAVSHLANVLLVDTIYCKLAHNTMQTTGNAIRSEYPNGGFGTLSMLGGAGSFKSKIMSCITNVVLNSIAKTNVQGLQTYDGSTLSSLASVLNSSIRETLTALGVEISLTPAEKNEKGKPAAQTDWQRLERELQLEQMNPVRMALCMPVLTTSKLANAAQLALYKAGVTVEALMENNYPDPIVTSYQNFILGLLSKA